jgi:hypothetical protein
LIKIDDKTLRLDIKRLQEGLGSFAKEDVRKDVRRAINDTGFAARRTLLDIAARTFEGGISGATKRGFFFEKATLDNLTGFVLIRKPASEWLRLQIKGGVRTPKQGGKVYVPSLKHQGQLPARFGNSARSTKRYLDRVLSAAQQSYSRKSDARRKTYFVGVPRNAKYPGSGLFMRPAGMRNQKFIRLLSFKSQASYNPIFDFFGITLRFAKTRLPKEIERRVRLRLGKIKGSTASFMR